ncbi:probable cytochrome P450 305a1 [Microplitis mediator]|uniref:probable cytochrome P450 305a1 n=1 Tax=Microplitis mediator TaxID=375433 RepID=UPI0025545489|nr:probable cytochrome P450 305a1 [Microplitis mediator]
MLVNLLCAVVICLIIALAITYHAKSKDTPPGPYPWPIFGNLKLLRKLSKEFGGQHIAFLKLAKQYNSDVISLRLGTSRVIVVCGFETVQKILRDENFDARPWNEFVKIRNMGLRKGITMTDGSEWKEMRGWLVRCLRNLGFGREEMSNKINDELKIIIDKLKLNNNGPVRMKPIIAPAVINVIWSLVTGERIDEENKLKYFLDLMERRSKAFDMAGGILSIFPWIRYFAPKTSGYELLVTLNNELKAFLMETIEAHKKKYIKGSEKDLIDMFLTEMYQEKRSDTGFTEDQLLMILIDIFIAGVQTTAVTLDFLFLYMTVHQDIQSKLHDELDSVIDTKRLPQLNDRPMLPFMEAVIAESQRLRLVVPIIGPRRALKKTNLNGYKIPENSCILMNIYSIHMDPEIFQNPQLFKPERFLVDNVYTPNKKLIFFGGGHRRCPGEIVAKSAIFLLFAGVMKNYKLLPVSSSNLPEMDPQPGLTISPKPYEVLLTKR